MDITFEFATRDDCLDQMVPSDLRQLVAERDAALRQRDALVGALREADGALTLASEAICMMQPCAAEECQAEQAEWKDVAEERVKQAQLAARAALAEVDCTEATAPKGAT